MGETNLRKIDETNYIDADAMIKRRTLKHEANPGTSTRYTASRSLQSRELFYPTEKVRMAVFPHAQRVRVKVAGVFKSQIRHHLLPKDLSRAADSMKRPETRAI